MYRAFHKSVKTLLVSQTGLFWRWCFFAPESVHTSDSQVNTQFFPPGLSVCLVSFTFFSFQSQGFLVLHRYSEKTYLMQTKLCEQDERQRQMEPSL